MLGLALALAYGGGLALNVVHTAEGGHERNEPPWVLHWFLDASLALPVAVMAVLASSALLRLRRPVGADFRRPAAAFAGLSALTVSVSVALSAPLHAAAFGVRHGGEEPGFIAHLLRDAALGLAGNLPIAAVFCSILVLIRPRPIAARAAPAVPPTSRAATRRDFLKVGGAGMAVATVAAGAGLARLAEPAEAGQVDVALWVNQGDVAMIDGVKVFRWQFTDAPGKLDQDGRGVVISAVAGDTVAVAVTNTLDEPHSFAIDGVVDSGPIAPGQTARVSFEAPAPGTYLYRDRLNEPANPWFGANRLLGLYGVLISHPTDGKPSSFEGRPVVAEFVWVMSSICPAWGEQARANRAIDTRTFDPRYFTINGRSGTRAVHPPPLDPAHPHLNDTVPHGRVGETALIRMVNATASTHAAHFHGNHVRVIAVNGLALPHGIDKDVVLMEPMDRKDVLLPFEFPLDVAAPPQDEPWHFPMHCHSELSQSAGGGLYPSGMLSGWVIEP